jgi:hypothetical protein
VRYRSERNSGIFKKAHIATYQCHADARPHKFFAFSRRKRVVLRTNCRGNRRNSISSLHVAATHTLVKRPRSGGEALLAQTTLYFIERIEHSPSKKGMTSIITGRILSFQRRKICYHFIADSFRNKWSCITTHDHAVESATLANLFAGALPSHKNIQSSLVGRVLFASRVMRGSFKEISKH